MATVGYTATEDGSANDGSVTIYQWTPLTTTNADGAPVGAVQYADRSVQVTGTFGAGGSITFQGSNDGTNWAALNTAQGAAVALTAATQLKQLVEIPRYIRPYVTAGDGTTSVTAIMVARRQNPLRT
jgi:hypothetical protein